MEVYYIGGSPGSGKSTMAQILGKKYGFARYKLDDFLFRAMKQAARAGKPHCRLARKLTPEETWMRPPRVQMEEEVAIYEEIFEILWDDLQKISAKKPVIAEGAGFMPRLMAERWIAPCRMACVVPSEAFQRQVFARRKLLTLFLWGCKDKAAAFENWMQRDALFAKEMLAQSRQYGYTSLLVDGSRSLEDNTAAIEDLFGLSGSLAFP